MVTEARTPGANKFEGPGPFMAIVRNHLDTEYTGTLEVELLKSVEAGNRTNVTGEMATVSYLSPFYGVTPYSGTSENEGFDYTQKSYGMWAVPPDVGTTVLVIFAEGNKNHGYWIGCVQERFMNFMVPGNASTRYNKENQSTVLPVGEYNKRTESGVGKDPTQFLKPVNTDAVAQLTNAGLLSDPIRGTTTSSARREVPSMVFGMSTPGPLDRRPGKPKVKVGDESAQTEIPASRLTGSSFVMDDGDPSMFRKGPAATTPSEYATLDQGGDPTLPMNELVRIRTRTGHQILFHNTEDLVYIAHGSGQSWIEMTALGTIEVYSKNNISFHSDADINFDAKNINLKASVDINMIAVNQMSSQTGANWDVLVGADGRLSCAGTSNIVSTGHYETAGVIHMNGPAAGVAGGAAGPTTVPAGSGSNVSSNPVAVQDGTIVPLDDTFAKGCEPVVAPGTGADGPAGGAAEIETATVTSTPSRKGPPTVYDGTANIANTGAVTVTVPPYDDAILRQARAGAATLTSASRTGPPTEYDPLP
jgi:hypothetical protein